MTTLRSTIRYQLYIINEKLYVKLGVFTDEQQTNAGKRVALRRILSQYKDL